MAIYAMMTADIQDTSLWDSVLGVTISSTQKRTGGYSYKLTGANGYAQKNITSTATVYLKMAVWLTTYSSAIGYYVSLREGSTTHIQFRFDLDAGSFAAYNGDGTLLGTSSGFTLTANTWYCLEIYAVCHDSTGAITVKVDGTARLTLTNQDTRNGATGTFDNFYANMPNSNTPLMYMDDIVCRDDAWPGTGGLYVLTPTDDGTDTGWTASAGNRWDCVSDNPPDDYTDYISTDATVADTEQTFDASNLTDLDYDAIPLVGIVAKAKLSAAGTGNVRPIILSNGSYSTGNTLALSISSQWATGFWTLNPDGSAAWDEAAVNALEIGIETV